MKISASICEPRIIRLSDGAMTAAIAARLKGVTVTVNPIDPAIRIAARYAAHREMAKLEDDSEDRAGIAEVAYVRAIARLGIIGWTGIGNKDLPKEDPDYEKDLPLTPATLAAALRNADFYDAIDRLYVTPDLDTAAESDLEKNG